MPKYDTGLYLNNYEILDDTDSGARCISIHPNAITISGRNENTYAFKNCNGTLESVSFPVGSKLTQIQNYAFYYCTVIQSIDFTNCLSLKTISNSAFESCKSLGAVTLPQNLEILGDKVFYSTNLKNITIPSKLTILPMSCFAFCSSLELVDIPLDSEITEIGKWVIRMSKVKSFTIPSKVTSIMAEIFEYCYLEEILVSRDNKIFTITNGILINNETKTAVAYPSRKTGDLVIPEGITRFASSAFVWSIFPSVTLPSTLTSIASYSMTQIQITEIDIPDSVTIIYNNAFAGCKKLTRVKLPKGLNLLPEMCFWDTNLSSIELPDTLTRIDKGCFMKCPNLKEVTLPENLTQLNGQVFDPGTKLYFSGNSNFYINDEYIIMTRDNSTISQHIGTSQTTINIHKDVTLIKKSAFSGKNFITRMVFPSDSKLETILESAFTDCTKMEFVNLPIYIKSIGNFAFQNCQKLQSIVLNSCRSIGDSSFSNCIALSSVNFEQSDIISIPDNCFYGCTSLTTIKLPLKLKYIGISSFSRCSNLNIVTFHDSLTTIGNNGFQGCSLLSVDLSSCSGMTNISDFCFSDNTNLESINFPAGITLLGVSSFSNTAISTLDVPSSVYQISSNAFYSCQSLSTINIPADSSLEFIKSGAFRDCFRIASINCESTRYRIVTEALFDRQQTSLILFPPASQVKFFSLPGSTVTISEGAFMSCVNLVSIFIPSNSVANISKSTFDGCINLKMINIPASVIDVGEDAFKGCNQLSCGCLIENKNKTYIDSLITFSKLPQLSTKPCSNMITKDCYRFNVNSLPITPFIAMI